MFFLSISLVCISVVVGFPTLIDTEYPHLIQADDDSLYLYLPQVCHLINRKIFIPIFREKQDEL